MVAYRHLLAAPVFERERLWYLRVGDQRTVLLRHGDGTPIGSFIGTWQPVFVYTGLACVHLLHLEDDGRQATWIVALDGRRLGDKLADLDPRHRDELRQAIAAHGLAEPRGLIGDGIQFIEPVLLEDLLRLADRPAATAASSQTVLAMLGAPRGLHTRLRYRPGDRTLTLGQGWVDNGAGHPCRAVGGLSVVETELLPTASLHLLALSLAPADASTRVVGIEISVGGRVVAHTRLDPQWQHEGAELAFWLAPELLGGRPLRIGFEHSGDFLLAGLRLMTARPAQEAVLSPEQLMLQFENLGDNCEFGLVQRHFGADPVGLLRFAGLRDPRRLIRFLDDDFGDFGEPGSLGVNIVGGEYWIVDRVYGFASHTFRYPHEIGAEAVISENEIKARYLRRKFREDLEDGEKILVYKRVVTDDLAEMLALHAALNRFGAASKLLWVTQAGGRHAPGDVEWVGDRLLRGYVGSISLSDANDFDPAVWLLLCRNALAAFEALPAAGS